MEAIACIGMNHFYSDQPELSLRFYRRLLQVSLKKPKEGVRQTFVIVLTHSLSLLLTQMGINNAELFNNLGLCCFYAQQYDMALACMERALSLATEDMLGEEEK